MAPQLTDRPWEGLPPEVAAVLRPELATLADEIVGAILVGVPGYARPMRGRFGRGVRGGVDRALRRFVTLIEEPAVVAEEDREMVRGLGRGEHRAGRSLDALQAAYRIGARVAWRRVARAGSAAGLAPDTLHLLAEAIFAYIDELAAESVEGYAQAQAADAGERERSRRALVRALVAEPPDPEVVERAAQAAAWPLPATLAGLAVDGPGAERAAHQLGVDALVTRDEDVVLVVWPDPAGPGRAPLLDRLSAAAPAALGPAVDPRGAGRSLRWARRCLQLARGGALGDGPLWRADEHLAALALDATGDDGLLAALGARRLAPFAALRPAVRARLLDTLLAWLQAQGHRPSVAAALHVHPQTVRYRLGQLRELLGAALDDPQARFELELALRAGAMNPDARGVTEA